MINLEESNIESVFRILREKRLVIEEQFKKLKEDLETIDRMEKILKEPDKQMSFFGKPQVISHEFENLNPTPAILKFFEKNPELELRATELAKELIRRGMKPNDEKMFPNTVSAVANVLERKGKIEREKKAFGKKQVWVYRKKKRGV